MTTLSTFKEAAKRVLQAAFRNGIRSGDLVRPGEVHLPGEEADFPAVMDYAEQQGWVKAVQQNGKDYKLTDAGFAVAQSAD
jgi:hypothetical protein